MKPWAMSKFALALGLWLVMAPSVPAKDDGVTNVKILTNIAYKTGAGLDAYEQECCRLDLYLPVKPPHFVTVVWLHGGGLTAGNKGEKFTVGIARSFAAAGVGFVVVNYRLSPRATYPAYIEDAAAAFAWTRAHIAEQGGDPEKVFLGGHSAGAYLTAMVGLDPRYLERQGLKPSAIAGLIPVSGQMMTHFTIRKERGLDEKKIIADEAAPINHVCKDSPRMLILMGDHDWPARDEENLYFVAAMKVAGNTNVIYRQIGDRTHGTIAGRLAKSSDPGRRAIFEFLGCAQRPATGVWGWLARIWK